MTKASRTSRSHTSSHESPTRVSSRDTRVTRVSSRDTRGSHESHESLLVVFPSPHETLTKMQERPSRTRQLETHNASCTTRIGTAAGTALSVAHTPASRATAHAAVTRSEPPLSTRSGSPARRVLVRATSGSRVTRERAVPSVSPPVTETGRSRAGGKGVRWREGRTPRDSMSKTAIRRNFRLAYDWPLLGSDAIPVECFPYHTTAVPVPQSRSPCLPVSRILCGASGRQPAVELPAELDVTYSPLSANPM
jgi:hypothetical protein